MVSIENCFRKENIESISKWQRFDKRPRKWINNWYEWSLNHMSRAWAWAFGTTTFFSQHVVLKHIIAWNGNAKGTFNVRILYAHIMRANYMTIWLRKVCPNAQKFMCEQMRLQVGACGNFNTNTLPPPLPLTWEITIYGMFLCTCAFQSHWTVLVDFLFYSLVQFTSDAYTYIMCGIWNSANMCGMLFIHIHDILRSFRSEATIANHFSLIYRARCILIINA